MRRLIGYNLVQRVKQGTYRSIVLIDEHGNITPDGIERSPPPPQKARKPIVTAKRRAILRYLDICPDKQASPKDIIANVREVATFHGTSAYLNQTLSAMVKHNLILRVSRGVYQSNYQIE
jgi:hypothetical protein